MKMEPIVSSETSAIRTQTPGNYPKRNKLHLEHGESLKTRYYYYYYCTINKCTVFIYNLKSSTRIKYNACFGDKLPSSGRKNIVTLDAQDSVYRRTYRWEFMCVVVSWFHVIFLRMILKMCD